MITLSTPGKAPKKQVAQKKNVLTKLIKSDSYAYSTNLGVMLQGECRSVLESKITKEIEGKCQLVFFSPPFPLNRKKRYDNKQGDEYKQWLADLAPLFSKMLTPTGSIVIELGNAWEPNIPAMSTLALEALIDFKKKANLFLCQQFICDNPARLPSPAQWVTVKRCRVKDSFTHVWWYSKTEDPYADNRNVLKPYSKAMLDLIKSGKYNSGSRPSEHQISESGFLKDNGGAIPSNVLSYSNTRAGDNYLKHCKAEELTPHPARMPLALPEFFIKFLTKPGDLVLDPFGGSNTTGEAAESLKRHWVSIEMSSDYIEGSKGRFPGLIKE